MSSPRSTYHHGDARSALTEAAASLLGSSGAAGLPLRRLAEHAGLSRQAPYNHFTHKSALFAELVRDGYERLAARTRATALLNLSPPEQLAKAAEVYIAFAQEQPALFRLMFGKELVNVAEHPAAQAAAASALAALSAIIGAVVTKTRVQATKLVAWSLVHGYTSLCVEAGLETPENRVERARLFA